MSTPAAERKGSKRRYNASAQEKLNHDRPERIGLGSKLNRRRCRNVKNHSDGGKGVLADSAPRNHGCDTVEKFDMAEQLLNGRGEMPRYNQRERLGKFTIINLERLQPGRKW